MNKILLAAEISAPKIPQWIINESPDIGIYKNLPVQELEILAKQNGFRIIDDTDIRGSKYVGRKLTKGTQVQRTSHNYPKFLSTQATEWAQSNITQSADAIRFNFSTPGRNSLGPHIDTTREWVLLYLTATGGNDHYTAFYKEKNQPDLIRPYGYHVDDYNQLTEIARIKIPVSTWVILNARVLHSVENIANIRCNYQISCKSMPTDINLENPIYCDI